MHFSCSMNFFQQEIGQIAKKAHQKLYFCLPGSLFSMHESSSACRVSHETQTWIRFQKITHRRNVNVEEKIIL